MRYPRLLIAGVLGLFLIGYCSAAWAGAKRVLVVTTEGSQVPTIANNSCGTYVVTDLTAAGLPFDAVTYQRFVEMSLGDHDVIFLNGPTSPVSVSSVLEKCQSALAEGRKVFINGTLCYRRYDGSGVQVEYLRYSTTLFGVFAGTSAYVDGTVDISPEILKDPPLSDMRWTHISISDFRFASQPPIKMMFGGKVLGFLGPQGGVLDHSREYFMGLLDYGKIATYLRYGRASVVGFANDRLGGKPIASFEVHVDGSSDPRQFDVIKDFVQAHDIPLTCLLVYGALNSSAIAKWNTLSDARMAIGSHTRTHPSDWPLVSNVLSETRDAIADQTAVIPATKNYFNWSGAMNPTSAQIDEVYAAGVLFGSSGGEWRDFADPSGAIVRVQRMPTTRRWMTDLAGSITVPYVLSYTLWADYPLWLAGASYLDEVQKAFVRNRKYGLYSYGQLHNYTLDPLSNTMTHGIHMSTQIGWAVEYLRDQGAVFLPVEDLTERLYDFVNGWIDYRELGDSSIEVTLYRPAAKANQAKVQARDGCVPVASGQSVLSQHMRGDMLYVDLRPEQTSTFAVHFAPVAVDSINAATLLPEGSSATVSGTVTAVFSGSCYIQAPNRTRGIKVVGDLVASEGETLVVSGKLATVNGERVILLD